MLSSNERPVLVGTVDQSEASIARTLPGEVLEGGAVAELVLVLCLHHGRPLGAQGPHLHQSQISIRLCQPITAQYCAS